MTQMLVEALERMLERVQDGGVILAAASNDVLPEQAFPTIHNFPGARHLGFGYFKANTEGGVEYNFSGGGAMTRVQRDEDEYCYFSYCEVYASNGDNEALQAELGYTSEQQAQYLSTWKEALVEDLR